MTDAPTPSPAPTFGWRQALLIAQAVAAVLSTYDFTGLGLPAVTSKLLLLAFVIANTALHAVM